MRVLPAPGLSKSRIRMPSSAVVGSPRLAIRHALGYIHVAQIATVVGSPRLAIRHASRFPSGLKVTFVASSGNVPHLSSTPCKLQMRRPPRPAVAMNLPPGSMAVQQHSPQVVLTPPFDGV